MKRKEQGDYYSNKAKMDFIKDLLVKKGFPEESFNTKRRYKSLVDTRSWFSWLCKKVFKNEISYPEMADYLQLANHTSCIHQFSRKQSDIDVYETERVKSIDLLEESSKYHDLFITLREDLKKPEEIMRDWVLKVEKRIEEIDGHINRDQIMEGWRREKINKTLESLKKELSDLEKNKPIVNP